MIVGLLMATLATQLIGRAQQAQVDLAATQLRQLEQSLELYKLDNGRYPSSDQGLLALVRKPAGDPVPRRWSPGGYAKRDQIQDPWGIPYQYRFPGDHNARTFDLFSYGPDGLEGGEEEDADIVNWDTGTLQ
jgi:general secretion pathway protein G